MTQDSPTHLESDYPDSIALLAAHGAESIRRVAALGSSSMRDAPTDLESDYPDSIACALRGALNRFAGSLLHSGARHDA